MRSFLTTLNIRFASTIIAVLLALPLSWWGGFTGFYAWLSPFIFLNSVFLLKSFVWLNALGVIVLLLSAFRKRWFCRYLCPVGYGCDFVSRYSYRQKHSLKSIPNIGKWLVWISMIASLLGIPIFILLDPLSFFNGFFVIFSKDLSLAVMLSFLGLPFLLLVHLFFPGIWCAKLCPLGGLQDEAKMIYSIVYDYFIKKNKIKRTSENGRRVFIASGIGAIAGLVVPKFLNQRSVDYIRPPASLPANMFNTLCIRCGNCIKACPTNIIVHHKDVANLTAWMTPEVSFINNNGYCLEDCNICGKVCPSGAINLFSVEAKKQLTMGLAIIRLDDCLLTNNSECDRCKISCGYNAINITGSNTKLQMIPVVDTEKCVGCGACAVICPPKTIEMVC